MAFGGVDVHSAQALREEEQRQRQMQEFQTMEELINFRTNPYYDNLVRFNYRY